MQNQNPVQQIINGIFQALLGIWIGFGLYLTIVGFMATWWIGLLGLADLALAVGASILAYHLFKQK